PALGRDVDWKVHRTASGFVAFAGIGVVAGMFGLGAGWANVPALNLLIGVATSASWIYLQRGAVLPLLVVPSVLGAIIGAKLGVRLLKGAKPAFVRRVVLTLLFLAGMRALLK